MPILDSKLDTRSEVFQQNKSDMLKMLEYLNELLKEASRGGGEEATARLRSREKMPIRERISHALDRDSPFLEISPLAAWRSAYAIGSGFVVGIGVIENVECVILGHDPSVRAGAFNEFNSKKLMRGLEIARVNRLPYVQFVESAGADLRGEAGEDPEAAIRRETGHFAESGRLFYEITELSKMRIPTISVVFGASTAGGAYQPGMSDYNIFIKNQSKVFLGGVALTKMATGEDANEEDLGGADMHTSVSGLGDYLARDEMDGIRMCREVMRHLNWRKLGPEPNPEFEEPIHNCEDMLGLVSEDLKSPFDVREVIMRIADSSYFEEFKPLYGPTLIAGWASIHGYPVGVLGNNGALFSEAAEKGAQFIQLCSKHNTPLIFLQNTTGYMVGTKQERRGIIKHGSKMIQAVTNCTVPKITLRIGASFGAGEYGMAGRSFDPRFLFSWPNNKLSVMGGEQAGKTMSQVAVESAKRRGEEPNMEMIKAIEQKIIDTYKEEGEALFATARIWDDGIIDPRDTRKILGECLNIVCDSEKRDLRPNSFGVGRM